MKMFNAKSQLFTVLTGAAAVIFLAALSGCAGSCPCEAVVKVNGVIAPGAEVTEVSTEFGFTEGPAADAAGNVYFTDQPNDRIMIYTTAGKLETFMQPSGRSNGLYFDGDGSLIACADEKNELWRINVKTKEHVVLAQRYEGKLLNAPNDAWVHPKTGWIYFSDPFYKRAWWNRGPTEQSCQGVYRVNGDGTGLVRVIDDLVKPNGLIGTPDGKTLYVADIQDRKTYAYDIASDGTLTNRRLFCEPGSDGMTLDACGNVYLTGDGVLVFNPAGEQIAHIKVPQRWTANVTFGGKDRKTLFMTASTGVYTLQMNVCGAQ